MQLHKRNTGGDTGEISTEKSFNAYSFTFENTTLEALKSTSITVFIQRNDGDDEQIVTKQSLLKTLLLGVFGESSISITTDAQGEESIKCLFEINENGASHLNEKEAIVIQLEKLPANSSTIIEAIDAPEVSNQNISITKKTVSSDQTDQVFGVEKDDVVLIDGVDFLNYINMKYPNGRTVKLTGSELKAISRDVDPIVAIKGNQVIQEIEGIVVLPLDGCEEIGVYKEDGNKIDFLLKNSNLESDDINENFE